jgi:hypothetical protein
LQSLQLYLPPLVGEMLALTTLPLLLHLMARSAAKL